MNKKVCYTSIFGRRDFLPVIKAPPPGWDFLCFTDENIPQESPEEKIWTIKKVEPYSIINSSKSSKLYKSMASMYLSKYDVSMWIDANIHIDIDFNSIVSKALKHHNIAIFQHQRHDQDAYHEGKRCINLGKDLYENIEPQLMKYRRDGYPSNYGLFECTIIMRRHNEHDIGAFEMQWWYEIKKHSKRDQISFSYLVWKTQININALSREKLFFERGAHQKRR